MWKVRPDSYHVQSNMHSTKNYYSSSLQQLQSTSQRLERRFTQIETLIKEGGASTSTGPPQISTVARGLSDLSLLSDGLMKYAEEGGRKWSAIGVDEWIEAGKWWLMKVLAPLLANRDIGRYFSDQLTHLFN